MSVEIIIGMLLVIGYLLTSIFYPMLSGGAGYTPTPRKMGAEAINLVELKKEEIFYDLGCGTGEILIEAAKVCDHVKGIEMEPVRWLIAKLRARNAQVIRGNLFKQDISDADVIFLFQYPGKINSRIAEKIKAETRTGTRVVSYLHPISNLELVVRGKELYLYRVA
jgi:precorrin-6B methylase 2